MATPSPGTRPWRACVQVCHDGATIVVVSDPAGAGRPRSPRPWPPRTSGPAPTAPPPTSPRTVGSSRTGTDPSPASDSTTGARVVVARHHDGDGGAGRGERGALGCLGPPEPPGVPPSHPGRHGRGVVASRVDQHERCRRSRPPPGTQGHSNSRSVSSGASTEGRRIRESTSPTTTAPTGPGGCRAPSPASSPARPEWGARRPVVALQHVHGGVDRPCRGEFVCQTAPVPGGQRCEVPVPPQSRHPSSTGRPPARPTGQSPTPSRPSDRAPARRTGGTVATRRAHHGRALPPGGPPARRRRTRHAPPHGPPPPPGAPVADRSPGDLGPGPPGCRRDLASTRGRQPVHAALGAAAPRSRPRGRGTSNATASSAGHVPAISRTWWRGTATPLRAGLASSSTTNSPAVLQRPGRTRRPPRRRGPARSGPAARPG